MKICTTNGTLKINFLQHMSKQNLKYLWRILANFRLHHFKSVRCRKLANIRKSMQIRKLFVQKNKFFCFLPNFLCTMTSPQLVKCLISNFCYYLTQPSILFFHFNYELPKSIRTCACQHTVSLSYLVIVVDIGVFYSRRRWSVSTT